MILQKSQEAKHLALLAEQAMISYFLVQAVAQSLGCQAAGNRRIHFSAWR
jgi:hypothetical protein